MKTILQAILAFLTKKIIKKYQPRIVGITGSIGKTSAKEAVFAVLSSRFNVRQNVKNYNNEIGVPLTVIGAVAKGKSVFGWLSVFIKAFGLLIFKDKDYPRVLVLEMGADHPGDIAYLVKIVKPQISVVTKVSATHLEFFGTVAKVAKEKQKIATCLDSDEVAILNYDDPLVRKMQEKIKAGVIFFGHHDGADVRAIELYNQGDGMNIQGIKFKIQYNGSTVPVFLPNVVGAHQMNAALIGAAVGIAFRMNLIEISQGLKNYHSPKGRMNVIAGIKNSLLIDDTYNSSPEAASAALSAASSLKIQEINRRVAILGDMLELGDITEQAHYDLGKQVAEDGFKLLVAVGENKEHLAKGAKENGLLNILTFDNSEAACDEVQNLIQNNDLVLIKGSQGARMERIVKELMKEPDRASELLIRQEKDWLQR